MVLGSIDRVGEVKIRSSTSILSDSIRQGFSATEFHSLHLPHPFIQLCSSRLAVASSRRHLSTATATATPVVKGSLVFLFFFSFCFICLLASFFYFSFGSQALGYVFLFFSLQQFAKVMTE